MRLSKGLVLLNPAKQKNGELVLPIPHVKHIDGLGGIRTPDTVVRSHVL
jgi:hypothetical protein